MITFLVVLLAVSVGIVLAALDEPGTNDVTRAAPEANEGPGRSPHAATGLPATPVHGQRGAVDRSGPRDDVRPVFAPAPLSVAVPSA